MKKNSKTGAFVGLFYIYVRMHGARIKIPRFCFRQKDTLLPEPGI
jgi:hypothetical protein